VSERKVERIPGSYHSSWGRHPLAAPGAGRGSAARSKIQADLAAGRRNLMAKLLSSPPYTVSAGASLAAPAGSACAIYHIRAGWACQFHDLANRHRAIFDIFLPGDVIGADTALHIRPLEGALALTSVTAGVIQEQDALIDLMASQHTALYITWLLAQRQQRADQLLISVLSLDARGRVATMLLDIYTRLRRRRLITGSTYNLPLTQVQIGSYLGLTVVHVNRVLRSLREERIVQVEKHCVTIFDLKRLRTLAQREIVENGVPPIVERPSSGTALSSGAAAD
jgi:CRP/FNR family transcriptional regulator, anaerobic regulatory protein